MLPGKTLKERSPATPPIQNIRYKKSDKGSCLQVRSMFVRHVLMAKGGVWYFFDMNKSRCEDSCSRTVTQSSQFQPEIISETSQVTNTEANEDVCLLMVSLLARKK